MSHSSSKGFTFGSLLMLSLLATIMVAVISLYTIVDSVFVSRHVSTNALSSINTVYPVINIVLGISVMLSAGSSATAAKKMSERWSDNARQTFITIILLNIGLGLVTALLGNLTAAPLSRLPGTSELLLEDCVTYLRWQLASTSVLVLQILLQMYFVTEGRPGIGLLLTLLVGVSDVLLGYLLIVSLGLGIVGAAITTITGYMIPATIGLPYFACSRRFLWLVRPHIERERLKGTCTSGPSEMMTNLSSGIIAFLFNLAMIHLVGEDGVMAVTIVQYSQFLLNTLFMGFSQGVSPVISFSYGGKNHSRFKQVFRTSLTFTAAISLAAFLLTQVTESPVVRVSSRSGTAAYALAHHGFTIFALSLLLSGLTIFASALFTAFPDRRISVVISSVHTFGLIIISPLMSPFLTDIDGVWLVIPIAEFGGVMLGIYYMKKLKDVYRYAQII